MNEEETMRYYASFPAFSPAAVAAGTEPMNLESIAELLKRLGNPQKKLKFIHIAGTNGKGSTAAFFHEILTESGYRAGLFTSPWVERFTERIRAGRREITGEELAAVTTAVRERADEMREEGLVPPSEFEVFCAAAFLFFVRRKCDMVVLEAGLGGKRDATNVIDAPELAVITSISYDHTEILGDTLEKIAAQKAGIIKRGSDVLLYPQRDGVEEVVRRACREAGAAFHPAEMPDGVKSYDRSGQIFDLRVGNVCFRGLEISLLGTYQIRNAAMAVNGAMILREKGWNLPDAAIRAGLRNTRWPARFELIRERPFVLLDGSHNVEGVWMLRAGLDRYFPDRKVIFVAGVLSDKRYAEMMDQVLPIGKRFYAVTPPSPRALPGEQLAAWLRARGAEAEAFEHIPDAVRAAMSSAGEDDVVCVFGSLYYVGIVRRLLISGYASCNHFEPQNECKRTVREEVSSGT